MDPRNEMTQQDAREGQDPHEPVIVPVRLPRAAEPHGERAAAGRRWRGSLVGLATLLAVAGVVAVFVYLPAWVERAEPEPAEPAAELDAEPAAPAERMPELTPEERAELTARAQALLAELLEQRQALNERSVQSWGDTTWSAYERAAERADDAFIAENLREAVTQYETALETGRALLERSEELVDQALAAGEAAIEAGNAGLAAEQFALVLAIDPGNARASRGQARAERLPEVLAAMRRGDAERESGALAEAAEAYREALAIDAAWTPARTALDAVTATLADRRFESLISQGYAAIDERRFELATELFNEAAAMRPGSAEARDGLQQAEQSEALNDILLAEIRGLAFERRELWNDAIARYEEALAVDRTLQFAIEGLERARRRADLDVKLESLLENPRRLLGDEMLAEARRLLDEARAIEEPGPRITGQAEELGDLIELASTPLKVPFISDGQTQVEVYRVGSLGTFTNKELELRPGTYTAVGFRRGFRDVREQFTVLPGQEIAPVTVICVEEI